MIVLAIAGLVLGIVFIAVPALQRNSRNAQRNADISNMQTSLNTHISNHNGHLPDALTATPVATDDFVELFNPATGTPLEHYKIGTDAFASGVYLSDFPTMAEVNKIAYINKTIPAEPTPATDVLPTPDSLHVIVGLRCSKAVLTNGNSDNAKTEKYDAGDLEIGTSRSLVIVYQLEGQPNASCKDQG